MAYHVVLDRLLSCASGLARCHTGWSEAVTTVLQMDEIALPVRGRMEACSVVTVCSSVDVIVLLLQVIDGADMDIVSLHNKQVMLPYLQSTNILFCLHCKQMPGNKSSEFTI